MSDNVAAFDWDAPLPESERERLLESFAENVVRRGLQTPAIWMLEIHAPLMPLAGQAAIVFSPVLGTFFAGGADDLRKYVRIMRQPGAGLDLVRRIESKTEEQQLAAR